MYLRYRSVQIKTVQYTGPVSLRPLSIDELQQLILLARDTGWIGNGQLLDKVLEYGLSPKHGKASSSKLDIFLRIRLSQAIWAVTLKNLAGYAERVDKLLKRTTHQKLIISPYKFADIISPGLLFMLQRDIKNVDTEKFSHISINHIFSKVKIKDRIYTKREKTKFIKKKFDDLCDLIFKLNSIEIVLKKHIPDTFFPETHEKFYIALKVAETLDWKQYFKILYHFNTAVQHLNLESNKLGGVKTQKAVLVTGVPGFFEIFNFPKTIPQQIIIELANDVVGNRLSAFSKYQRKVLKQLLFEGIKTIPNEIIKKTDKGEIIIYALNNFASLLKKKQTILEKSYEVYYEQLQSAFGEFLGDFESDITAEIKTNSIPDCYILVEGITDYLSYNHFINLLNKSAAYLKAIKCTGKNGVYHKYRDIIENESYIGGIITVLDSDAITEHNNIKKIDSQGILVKNYIYEKGSLEDLFNKNQHAKALVELYSLAYRTSIKELCYDKKLEAELKKLVWNEKKVEFDKVKYISVLLKNVKRQKDIPKPAQNIIKQAIEFGVQCYKKNPRIYSVHKLEGPSEKLKMLLEKT